MTASTQSLTTQGIAGAIPIQQGPAGPGFTPLLTEQILGLQQPYTFPGSFGFGAPYGTIYPYAQVGGPAVGLAPPMAQSPIGAQFMPGFAPYMSAPAAPQVQQVVQALASQVMPVAQQAILPLFVAAVQQLMVLIGQIAATQLAGQQAAWPWQQPAWQSTVPWAQPIAGTFGQA